MKRITTLIAAVMVLGLAAAAQAGIAVNYTYLTPSDSLAGVQMNHWVSEFENRASGKVDLKTLSEAETLPAKDMFRFVVSGKYEVGCVSLSAFTGNAVKLPAGMNTANLSSLRLMQIYADSLPLQFRRVKVVSMFLSENNEVYAVVMNRRAFRILPKEAKTAIGELALEPVA